MTMHFFFLYFYGKTVTLNGFGHVLSGFKTVKLLSPGKQNIAPQNNLFPGFKLSAVTRSGLFLFFFILIWIHISEVPIISDFIFFH